MTEYVAIEISADLIDSEKYKLLGMKIGRGRTVVGLMKDESGTNFLIVTKPDDTSVNYANIMRKMTKDKLEYLENQMRVPEERK